MAGHEQTYLTPAEAAEYVRLSLAAFRSWAARHAIPVCRMSARRLLYRRKDLDLAVQRRHLSLTRRSA